MVIRHLLEIRFEKHIFNFIDYKGELLDFLNKKGKFEKIKVSEDRIDIATEDLSFFIFLSSGNLGLQIDGSLDFAEFKNKVERSLTWIKTFGKYKLGKIKRIGTKSTVLEYPSASKYEKLVSNFNSFSDKNLIFQGKTNSKIGTSILNLRDCVEEDGYFHLMSCVTSKEDAIKNYFNSNPLYHEKYGKDFGVYTEIDYFQNNETHSKQLDNLDFNKLINICVNNIDRIELIHKEFLDIYYA